MTEAATNTDTCADTDVLILGAGPVGTTLALALAGSRLRVWLVDRQAPGGWQRDPRALALAYGSRQLLERLAAWNAAAATPIRQIQVSQRGGFGGTQIAAADHGLPALGYVMRYGDLVTALHARLAADCLLAPAEVADIAAGSEQVDVQLDHSGNRRRISARLVVHAEGTPRDDAGLFVRDYGQHAVVCEATPEAPHGHRAWERFTPDGPLALLPIGDDYAVVFTVPPARAGELLAMGDGDFLAALNAQFGGHVRLVAAGRRASFPLALRLRRELARGREVWLGNTAQSLHPVSGQGFNLGLRDAWELARTLLDAADGSGGMPAGATLATALAAYARSRRADRYGAALFTDGIVRLFSNDLPPLRALRGLGLGVLDALPPLRDFVARRMIWGARAWF